MFSDSCAGIISVREMDGSILTLEIDDDFTVENLKGKIDAMYDIPKCLQTLYLVDSSNIRQDLVDDIKLSDYYELESFFEKDLFLIQKPISFEVQSQTKKIPISIRRTDKIQMLKTKIFQKERIPQDKQRLFFKSINSSNEIELEDHKTLKECTIIDGSLLRLCESLSISF